MIHPEEKIFYLQRCPHDHLLRHFRNKLKNLKQRLVATNGIFDLCHPSHLDNLLQASQFGDSLWIGINGDEAVKELKGQNRPIIPENDRAIMLASLYFVDKVIIFDDIRATNFLKEVNPDVYIKGSDYSIEKMDKDEYQVVKYCQIEFTEDNKGYFTSDLIKKIKSL